MQGDVLQHADLYAGLLACNAILAALFHRERSGLGQHLDVAMGEALLYVNEHGAAEIAGHPGAEGFATWTFETFRLGNGRSVHLLGNPAQLFPLLAQALSIPVAPDDPRFASEASRNQNRDALVALLSEAIARIPSQGELEARLEGLPAVLAGVRTTRELADSDWALERGVLTEVAPGLRVPTAPWRADDLSIGPAAAQVAWRGQHNREVLGEWLSIGATEYEALEASGVLQSSELEPPSLTEAPRRAFRDSSGSGRAQRAREGEPQGGMT
jgi:crotonobetainyl-CoA:carnitine CoA-transferase CaiB-like acyl-CoA transferase